MNRHFACLFLALVVPSCTGGTETGNPLDSSSLALHSTSPSDVSVGASGPGLQVVSAWLSLESVDVVIGADCANPSSEVEFEEQVSFDLTDTASNVRTLDFARGPLCALEIEAAVATAPLPAGAPPELLGQTLLVQGFTAAGTPFVLESAESVSWELAASTPFVFQSDTPESVVATFDVATWFDGIDMDALPVDANGTLRIGPSSNETALEVFQDNVERSLVLARDENGNGLFDMGETVLAEP